MRAVGLRHVQVSPVVGIIPTSQVMLPDSRILTSVVLQQSEDPSHEQEDKHPVGPAGIEASDSQWLHIRSI